MYLKPILIQNKYRLVVQVKNNKKEKKIKKREYVHSDEYYYTLLRKNIRKYRKLKSLTQQDLADMTDLSREYVCDIENEKRNKHPSIAVVGRISEALKVEFGKFFQK